MADSMVIGLELQNLQTVLSGLKQVSDAVGSIQGTINKTARNGGVLIQSATINALTITGGNITINQKSGATRPPRAPRPDPTFADKLRSLLMSSRFGSNGLMPLVGKAVDLLGVEAVAAAAAIRFMWQAANEAADSLRNFRQGTYTSGGTTGEVAGLQAFGGAVGKSVNDMAALSRELNRSIASNGVAMGFANNIGLRFSFEPFGEQDAAKNLLKNINAVRDADKQIGRTATVQALRAIGAAGEDLIQFLDIPEKMMADIARAQQVSQMVNNPRSVQDAAEFNTQLGLLSVNFQNLKTSIGSQLLPVFTIGIEFVNLLIEGFAHLSEINRLMNIPLRFTVGIFQSLMDTLTGKGLQAVIDDLHKAMDPNYVSDDANRRATEANTDAVNANTTMMRGFVGGGENARRALPAAYQQNGGQSSRWIDNANALGSMGV